jgi:hypothetical protein
MLVDYTALSKTEQTTAVPGSTAVMHGPDSVPQMYEDDPEFIGPPTPDPGLWARIGGWIKRSLLPSDEYLEKAREPITSLTEIGESYQASKDAVFGAFSRFGSFLRRVIYVVIIAGAVVLLLYLILPAMVSARFAK